MEIGLEVHLSREIVNLKKRILSMGALVEDSIQKALRSLQLRDPELAQQVISADEDIDAIEVEVEEDCLKILALYQPVAHDLRFVVACLKINNDLERIADQAANIAERAKFLANHLDVQYPHELTEMVREVQNMLKICLDSFVNGSETQALSVISRDDFIDNLHRQMYVLMQERMKADLNNLECYVNLLSVSRQLERVADQVTNIAEDVVYLVRGSIVRHQGTDSNGNRT